MIAQAADLLASVAIGVALGALCFGRLWRPVRRLLRLDHPMLWLIAGTLARLAAVVAAYYLLSHGHWAPLLACLIGVGAVWVCVAFSDARGTGS